jgi:hypothetical protein
MGLLCFLWVLPNSVESFIVNMSSDKLGSLTKEDSYVRPLVVQ